MGFWLAVIISVGPKLEMEKLQNAHFFHDRNSLLFIGWLHQNCIGQAIKNQNDAKKYSQNQENNQHCLMVFGVALIVQGWFPNEKEKLKDYFGKDW